MSSEQIRRIRNDPLHPKTCFVGGAGSRQLLRHCGQPETVASSLWPAGGR